MKERNMWPQNPKSSTQSILAKLSTFTVRDMQLNLSLLERCQD